MVLMIAADSSADDHTHTDPDDDPTPFGDHFVAFVLTSRALSQEAVDRIWAHVRPVDIPDELRSDVRPPSKECWSKFLQKADDNLRSAVAVCLQDPAEVREFAEMFPGHEEDLDATWLLRDASEFTGSKIHREFAAARNAAAVAHELDTVDPEQDPENRVLGSSVALGLPGFRDAVMGLMTNDDRRLDMVRAILGAVHTSKTARFVDLVSEIVQSGRLDPSDEENRLPPGVIMTTPGGIMYALSSQFEPVAPIFDWKTSISKGLSKAMEKSKAKEDPHQRSEYGSTESRRTYLLDRYNLHLLEGEDELAATLVMHSSAIPILTASDSVEKAWEVYYEAVDLLPPAKWLKWASGEFREPTMGFPLPPTAPVDEILAYGSNYRAELLGEISSVDAAVLSAIQNAAPADEDDESDTEDITATGVWKTASGESDSDTPYTDRLCPPLRLLAWPVNRIMADPAEEDREMSIFLAAYYAVARTADADVSAQVDVVETAIADGYGSDRTICEIIDGRVQA